MTTRSVTCKNFYKKTSADENFIEISMEKGLTGWNFPNSKVQSVIGHEKSTIMIFELLRKWIPGSMFSCCSFFNLHTRPGVLVSKVWNIFQNFRRVWNITGYETFVEIHTSKNFWKYKTRNIWNSCPIFSKSVCKIMKRVH